MVASASGAFDVPPASGLRCIVSEVELFAFCQVRYARPDDEVGARKAF